MDKCNDKLHVKAVFVVSKRSERWFKKFAEEGNIKKIQKQIKEGKLKRYA